MLKLTIMQLKRKTELNLSAFFMYVYITYSSYLKLGDSQNS